MHQKAQHLNTFNLLRLHGNLKQSLPASILSAPFCLAGWLVGLRWNHDHDDHDTHTQKKHTKQKHNPTFAY